MKHYLWLSKYAQMAELVDAQVSDTCIERCGGSSPLPGTIQSQQNRFYRGLILNQEYNAVIADSFVE